MSTQRHILIADPDTTERAALAAELAGLGYTVTQTASGSEATALAMSRSGRIDLMMVHSDLPDIEGSDLVARLRRRGVGTPIILITDSAAEDDVVGGLDAGADDVMVRPMRQRELGARLRAHLRAGGARGETDLRIGPATFRPSSRTLIHPDVARPLKLTEKETALLLRLYRGDGRPVSRLTLLREVWGYSPETSSHTVETHIYRLRRKIEPTPRSVPLLISESGGYRLTTETQMVPAGLHDAPATGWTMPLARPSLVSPALYRAG